MFGTNVWGQSSVKSAGMRRGLAALGATGCVLAALTAMPARAQSLESATVAEVIDGDTLRLDDGREVRLIGIQAPKLALGRRGFEPWPLAEAAKAALTALSQPGVALLPGNPELDRHGRMLADVFDPAGRWLLGEMVARGMARGYSFADQTRSAEGAGRIEDLLALERRAREGQLGIWDMPFYRVRGVTETPYFIDSFQVVEGMVTRVTKNRNDVYLDFGDDWRTDFSVFAPRTVVAASARAGLDLESLAGQSLRVRGWLKWRSGPMIELSHPQQIERPDIPTP
jgi:endonuclease YncB( thermonuclease family)